MPGILGIISAKSEKDLFNRMIKSADHYQYAVDQYEKEGIHLARLHLNFVNTVSQPVFSHDGRYGLIMIGEIFSYRNIEADKILSDSNFLLNILIREGLKTLTYINGHFSAAWYDHHEKKLTLISDRFGTRPLYYALNRGRLLFGHEVKTILEDDISRDPDDFAISQLFHFTHLFGHRTLFSDIHQLPEASCLIFQNGTISIHKYWDFEFDESTYTKKKITQKSENAYTDELDSLMELAMKRVMNKNSNELLLSLSGGLDSRYVAAYAHRFGLENLTAFTFGPENCDDQRYAKQVAGKLQINHKTYEVLPEKIWKYAEEFGYYSDYMGIINGPLQGFQPLQDHYRKKSVTISSQMADAIFGGNLWRRKLKYLMMQDTFNAKSGHIMINIFNLIDENLLKELFTDDFYLRIKNGYREVPEQYIAKYKHPLFSYINLLMNEHGRRGTLCGNLMNNLFIETRMPSYDYNLMDFAYKLPLTLRFNQHTYRKVFSREFPELAKIKRERYNLRIDSPDICYDLRILENKIVGTMKNTCLKPVINKVDRWNKPTYIDHNRWFRKDLYHLVTALLMDKTSLSRKIYRKGGIERIIMGHQQEGKDHSKLIWQMVNLEYFFRKYID